jgi:hypothetical protein
LTGTGCALERNDQLAQRGDEPALIAHLTTPLSCPNHSSIELCAPIPESPPNQATFEPRPITSVPHPQPISLDPALPLPYPEFEGKLCPPIAYRAFPFPYPPGPGRIGRRSSKTCACAPQKKRQDACPMAKPSSSSSGASGSSSGWPHSPEPLHSPEWIAALS